MTTLFFSRWAGRSPRRTTPAALLLPLGALLLAGALLLGMLHPDAARAQEGEALFPDLPLQGKLSQEMIQQLGISGTPFRISDVPSEYLFVEIFSMYCPYCQRDAPEVNALFERVRGSELWEQMRFLGIGTGNTQYEVDFYAQQFKTPFPMLPDEEYVLHSALGNIGTPYYLLLRRNGPDQLEIVHAVEGSPDSLEEMFREMLRKAGLR